MDWAWYQIREKRKKKKLVSEFFQQQWEVEGKFPWHWVLTPPPFPHIPKTTKLLTQINSDLAF